MTTSSIRVRPCTYPLAGGTCAVGTSAYAVAGLLPTLGRELHTGAATTGQLLTITAVTCAIAGPVVIVATRRWQRRRLLVVALLVCAFGNLLAALAPTFMMLAVARVITAVGIATYTAGALAMAGAINPPTARARSMATVFSGLTLALLVGVPLSSTLSRSLGSAGVFALIAGLCVLAALAVAMVVPAVDAPQNVPSVRDRIAAVADRQVLAIIVLSLLSTAGTFTLYTFVSPFVGWVSGAPGSAVSVLLGGYGLGAIVGNLVGGLAADRYGARGALLVALGSCTVVLAVLPVGAVSVPGAALLLAAWGFAYWSTNAPIAAVLSRTAPDQASLLLSLNSSGVYFGMSLGAMTGGMIVTGAGMGALAPVAAVLAACAAVVAVRMGTSPRSKPKHAATRGRRPPRSGAVPLPRAPIGQVADHVR